MSQEDLVQRILTFLEAIPGITAKPDGYRILKDMESQHGLLVERAYHIYSFSHLTFHEFFTAYYIVTMAQRAQFLALASHAHDSRWHEVITLTASRLPSGQAERFFQSWITVLKQQAADSAIHDVIAWSMRWSNHKHPQQAYRGRLHAFIVRTEWYGFYDNHVSADALAHARNSVNALNMALALDPDRAPAFALAFTNVLNTALALDPDHTSAFTIMLANDLVRALDRDLTHNQASVSNLDSARIAASDLSFVLHNANDMPSMDERNFVHNNIKNFKVIIQSLFQRSINMLLQSQVNAYCDDPQSTLTRVSFWFTIDWIIQQLEAARSIFVLHHIFGLIVESIQIALQRLDQSRIDQAAVHKLQTLLATLRTLDPIAWSVIGTQAGYLLTQYQHIGRMWYLSEYQLDIIAKYLNSTSLLIECVKLARIRDRDAILNEIFLLPDNT